MILSLKGLPSPYTEENKARLKDIRRVVALRDLIPGDVLKENDTMGIFRSRVEDANGLNPFFIGELEGKVVTRPVQRGLGLSTLDVK
jgi:sialic acid synthase SpsE